MIITEPQLRLIGADQYWVEVLNDDASYGLIVGAFDSFGAAYTEYDRLMTPRPLLRLVMRQRSQMIRNHIPARLHNQLDRRHEYPTE